MTAVFTPNPDALGALRGAALSDTFDPLALSQRDGAVDSVILEQLAAVSDEVNAGGAIAWRMRGDVRQEVLRTLAASPDLLDDAGKRMSEANPYGQALVRALKGQKRDVPPSSALDRETEIVAYEVVAASLSGAPELAPALDQAQVDLARLRAEAAMEGERKRSHAILSGPLIARVAERRIVSDYIATGGPSGDLPAPASPAVSLRPFLVTGCAGAGKSALMADLIRERRDQAETWAPVVLLDFDRPANCRGGPGEWYSELTRQIALGRPDLTLALKRLRSAARQSIDADAEPDSPFAGFRLAEAIRSGLAAVLAEHGGLGGDLLVVIDTFEEVLIRSDLDHAEDTLFADVLRWASELGDIQDLASPPRPAFASVRIIVSGRSRPDLGEAFSNWFCGEREISALADADAKIFLRSRDREGRLTPAQVDRAVAVVGGHPLSLILFERFARQQPLAVEEVLAHANLSKMLGGEDAARSLYARFLQRLHVRPRDGRAIDPEKVRRIAHPGLVLREVTVAHLENIIAPGCGLTLAQGEAADLFEQLTAQVWLVEEVRGRKARTVRHRADVRRLMLPMMNGVTQASADASDELLDSVRSVRQTAVRWFSAHHRHDYDENQIEAAYHIAFLDEIGDLALDAPLWRGVWNLAPDDAAAMPPRAAALVRFHGRGPSSLSAEQTALLPGDLIRGAYAAQANESLAQGRGLEAVARAAGLSADDERPDPDAPDHGVFGRRRERGSAPPSIHTLARDDALAAEVNAAFLAGQYRKAAGVGWRAIIGMASTSLVEPLPIKGDITNHWIWRAALARMVAPEQIPYADWLESRLRRLLSRDRVDTYRPDSAGLMLAAAVFVASNGELTVPHVGHRLFDWSVGVRRRLSTAGDIRLASLALQWTQEPVDMVVAVDPRLLPPPFEGGDSLRLHFQPRDFPLPPDAPPRREMETGPAGLRRLNARLPELITLALTVVTQSLAEDPQRMVRALQQLNAWRPDLPRDLNPEMLYRRLPTGNGSSRTLQPVIDAANTYGALPQLVACLNLSGPPVGPLTQLERLMSRYVRLLSPEAS